MTGPSRILLAAVLLGSCVTIGNVAAEDLPADRNIGRRMPNFSLRNAKDEPVSLYGFRGNKAVVLIFLGVECPLGNLYMPRLEELSKAYADKKVKFIGINSNAGESSEAIAKHAKEFGVTFPILRDKSNLVADLALAQRTCEAIVLDGTAVIRYRGAIDDQYGLGTRKPRAEHNYLTDAIDEVLAGKPVKVAATEVAGCPIDRLETVNAQKPNVPRIRSAPRSIQEFRDAEEAKVGKLDGSKITYAADVAGILQNRCQSCHRPGQVGPFPLLTYDDARKHLAGIAEVVEDYRMPPWHADPRYGHFTNDRSLDPKERATLLAWVEAGGPLGDASKVPAAKTFPGGWSIGTPDVVFEIPEPYVVPAQGVVDYVTVRVPTNFKEDVWIQAAEAQPTDRSVVHHIIVYVDDHGRGKNPAKPRARGFGGGRDHLVGYAPGDMPLQLPDGIGKKIPAGSDFVFQLHYTPNGKIRPDRSRVGLIFSKAPVKQEAFTLAIPNTRFVIPPGADNHEVRSTFNVPVEGYLLSFMPHMHLRGKDFEYGLTLPGKTRQTLLSVPAYDFAWQSYYALKVPIKLPVGARIDCIAHFDNSEKNPNNPNPKQAVGWGDQTYEEMMIGYIDFVVDLPAPVTALPPTRR